jgi:hypothetical protein
LSVWQAVWVRVPEPHLMPGRFFLKGRNYNLTGDWVIYDFCQSATQLTPISQSGASICRDQKQKQKPYFVRMCLNSSLLNYKVS